MNKPNYQIAIPSYRRAEILSSTTIPYLKRTNVDLRSVTVFLSDEKEWPEYKKLLPSIKIIAGVPTLKGQRRFINDHYPEGTRIFSMEDDIKSIVQSVSTKQAQEVTDLHSIIISGFGFARQAGTQLFGFAPTDNPFYNFGKGISTGLRFIDGTCYGFIAHRDPKLHTTQDVKEDYERTLLYYTKFGSVIRFGGIGFTSVIYKTKGGLQENNYRTKEKSLRCSKYLIKKFPGLVSINEKRQGDMTEILLKRIG